MKTRRFLIILSVLSLTLLITAPVIAQTPLSFSKSFSPATIGPGSVSTLTFSITNNTSGGADSLAFTDNLPAGVTVAAPAKASSTCGGNLSAPEGGGTIGLDSGLLAAGATCTIKVDVTSGTVGVHTNTSGTATSSVGSGGPATADLTVDAGRPGFSKSFSPSAVVFGDRSTLTFTVDNSGNTSGVFGSSFSDSLPPGMAIASPSNKSTDCPGATLSAPAGGNMISLSSVFSSLVSTLAAGATCTASVDVLGNSVGALGNTSGELTSVPGTSGTTRSSGKASAVLTVSGSTLLLTKSFVDDPTPPGGTVDLEFTIRNLDRDNDATGITFTDDLDAAITGLDVTGTLPANPCGDGSSLSSAAGLLTLSDGALGTNQGLPGEGVCTFTVTLQVPSTAASGVFTNTTGPISGVIDGDIETGDPASDALFVEPAPRLTKTFLDNPVAAGDSSELEFTITNTSATSAATDIAFEDVFADELPTASGVPADGFCGPGSTATYTPRVEVTSGSANPARLVIADAELAAGDSCTFSLTVDVADDASARTYANTTSEITAIVDSNAVAGTPASDNLEVVAPPVLLKEFIDDPAQPGGTVTLRFTVTYDANGDGFTDFDVSAPATDITFTDNLEAVLAGLAPSGALPTEPCGPGSALTFAAGPPGILTLTGGALDPDTDPPIDVTTFRCSFDVVLDVPAGATPGSYTNTTSSIQATVSEGPPALTGTGPPASDDLRIAGLELSKEFLDDPVVAGGQVTLRFTLDNNSPTEDASSIAFSDNLDDTLDSLSAASGQLPIGACGGTLIGTSGDTNLSFSAGSLLAGTSCTFDVVLDVPAGAVSDTYTNTTSAPTATVGGGTVAFEPASDELTVSSDILAIAKAFVDDPAAPGGAVTLSFTIDNLSATEAVADIAFTDDLDAVLSGLAASSGPTPDPPCGAGSTLTGTSILSLAGGSLAAGASCTFDVTLTVPNDAVLGSVLLNTTSEVTGTVGAGLLGVTGDPASAELRINGLEFSKSFLETAEVGGTVTLSFTISNPGDTTVTGLSFTDDLDAVVPGLVATGLPLADPCGAGSSLTGTSVLTLTDGTLPPGGDCTFSVELSVPATAVPGSYTNTTSELRQVGGGFATVSAPPASAELEVIPDVDIDDDGVPNDDDVCPDTVIPEGVPTERLGVNRHALVDDDFVFDTTAPRGGGNGPRATFTTTDTAGCSCEQIIAELGLGQGHVKFGCSKSAMEDWIDLVNGGGGTSSTLDQGRGTSEFVWEPEPEVDPLVGPALTVEVIGPGTVSTDRKRRLGERMVGLFCAGGATCSLKFEAGTQLKLQARPDGRATFAAWSGACYGDGAIITVDLTADTACTAIFESDE